jgi:hypothetical protein
MARKRARRRMVTKTSVHLSLPADVASRLRSYAAYHGREMSEVVAEGVRLATRGFTVRQEPQGPRILQAASPAGEGEAESGQLAAGGV